MLYTHRYFYKEDISGYAWAKIKSAIQVLVSTLPAYTHTAGGDYAHVPLENAVEALAGDNNWVPLTWKNANNVVHTGSGDFPGLIDIILFRSGGCDNHETDRFLMACHNVQDHAQRCTTARKPYDLLVCATLLLVNHYAPQARSINSDGNAEDWWPALELVRKNIDQTITLPVNVDPLRISERQELTFRKLSVFRQDTAQHATSLFF